MKVSSRARFFIAITAVALLTHAAADDRGKKQNDKNQNDKKLNQDINTRSLQGLVTSMAGKAVNGAIVQLTDMKTLQIRSYITHEDGAYHFAGLSTNVEYQVKAATEQGESSKTKTLSVFDNKKTAVINLKLKPQKHAARRYGSRLRKRRLRGGSAV